MKTRDVKFESKGVDEQGNFEGWASVFGNVDSYNDIVMPGAFADDLRANGSRRVLLSQHNPSESIGWVDLEETSSGLKARGRLLLDLPKAREEYVRMKHGLVKGLSIGFQTIKERFRNGARELTAVRLFEISAVTFPANELAVVTGVKGDEDTLETLVDHITSINASLRRRSDDEAMQSLLSTVRDMKQTLNLQRRG
jgi:HK97 family phage prohead protease